MHTECVGFISLLLSERRNYAFEEVLCFMRVYRYSEVGMFGYSLQSGVMPDSTKIAVDGRCVPNESVLTWVGCVLIFHFRLLQNMIPYFKNLSEE